MRNIVLGFVALAMSGTAAVAADPTVYVPLETPLSAPAGHDWSGWYLGGYVGGLVGGEFTGFGAGQPGLRGVDAGGQIFYNAQYDNWVLSPFASVTLPVQTSTVFSVDVKVDWAANAGLRAGYAIDRWLPYGFIGGVVGRATAEGSGSGTHTGYLVGAGIDYALDDRWVIGARYTYYSLGAQNYSGAAIGWHGSSIVGTLAFKLH